MKILNLVTLALIIIGGVNWGLVGLFDMDLVATLFGTGSAFSRLIYILVGLSAVYQLVPFGRAITVDEVTAEATGPGPGTGMGGGPRYDR